MVANLLSSVERFSDDIGMQFDLDKCTKFPCKRGLLVKSKNITVDINMKITEFEHFKTYKHLGINEANGKVNTVN